MIIEIIPPGSWKSFLKYFSNLHKELFCSIEILDGPSELNAGEHLKFSEIAVTEGSPVELNIKAEAGEKEINHIIKNIKQIGITRGNESDASSIMIQSEEDFITTLTFTRKENS